MDCSANRTSAGPLRIRLRPDVTLNAQPSVRATRAANQLRTVCYVLGTLPFAMARDTAASFSASVILAHLGKHPWQQNPTFCPFHSA